MHRGGEESPWCLRLLAYLDLARLIPNNRRNDSPEHVGMTIMAEEAAQRPRLRPYLAAAVDHNDPRYYFVWDKLRLADGPRRFSREQFAWMQLLDGQRSLAEIQASVAQVSGIVFGLERFQELVATLDEALFLDSPRFRARLDEPIRRPSCIGCYEGEPAALRRQLRKLFTHPRGSGLPEAPKPNANAPLRAALVPHMDYGRGGLTYTWGFREVFEQTDASLFVIIGTSHYSLHRFTLTRKNFQTPFGAVPTDQSYIDRLVHHYGSGLFDDEVAHLPEHSIELEVVFLQYLYEDRPIRIVPLVVGSFEDCVSEGKEPRQADDIGRMIEALRRAEAETKEPICYLISGDLAHVGPKFGDPEPVSEPFLEVSRKQDEALVKAAEAVDLREYFRVIAEEGDARRICGLPPTYTLLDALRPRRGKLLHYDQYVHPQGHESVSFASMAFYR
jgi:AmmeMemoRadiSam system protein B